MPPNEFKITSSISLLPRAKIYCVNSNARLTSIITIIIVFLFRFLHTIGKKIPIGINIPIFSIIFTVAFIKSRLLSTIN
ncbi:hypothetical protein CDFC105_02261 [Clostridioides difficile]|nr:hypothetical protein CDFC105_02261 [Clostridioides difficile]SJW28722.1 Uncharacterised protein [Clostridioides difficile]